MASIKYREVGISGKFRMLHIAHKELILRAIGLSEHVHVFIVDVPSYKRYATIPELIAAFEAVFATVGFSAFTIHVITEELSGKVWDQRVLSHAPGVNVMFDSKEQYENILIPNAFISLKSSVDISVTAIEARPYDAYNASLIADEFWPYLLQHICIIGLPNKGKTVLSRKLAAYYQTRYQTDADAGKCKSVVAKRYVFHDEMTKESHLVSLDKLFVIEIGAGTAEEYLGTLYDQVVREQRIVQLTNIESYDELFLATIDIIEQRYNSK